MKASSTAPAGNLLTFLRSEFARLEAGQASDPAWLRSARRKAFGRFIERGFPTTRDEEWRFTPIAPLLETSYSSGPAATPVVAAPELASPWFTAPTQLTFVNGRYAPSLSRAGAMAGVSAGSLADALAARPDALAFHLARAGRDDDPAFRALNTAFLLDGAVLEIAPNLVVEDPIHLVFVTVPRSGPVVSQPRTLVIAGENSQVRIVESHIGPGGATYFTNPVTDVMAGAGAVVDHLRVQLDGDAAYHIGTTRATLGRQASYTSHAVTFGAAISRCAIEAVLAAEGAVCTLNGLNVASGRQLADHHTTIDHARAHCSSHELYKGILAGRARAVFSGKIVVRPDAQKTDAKQTNKTLLLSDEAQINTKPQLEILANDVKCTHGATVGQLSEEALFYLRTRGLGRDEARQMLIRAFAGEMLARVPLEPVRAGLEALFSASLERAAETEARR